VPVHSSIQMTCQDLVIETTSPCEGRLGYIIDMNHDLVIARKEINLGELLGSR
jgi:hypothetical protein